MPKVIRVYGRADSYDIELSPRGDKWEVNIPPDMTDGVYACQLTAVDENGEYGYWVGELYMCSGVCCLKINEMPYKVRMHSSQLESEYGQSTGISFHTSRYNTEYKEGRYEFFCRSSSFDAAFDDGYEVEFRKGEETRYRTDFTKASDAELTTTQISFSSSTNINEIRAAAELHTEFRENTEIFIRKGCRHYGG
jgi:hypothetical protein